jgi:4-hydroxybenzoate polyprenyltransferase
MKKFFDLVAFEHGLFAGPMAITGAILSARGWPGFYTIFWICICFITARTAAMGFNRLVDLKIDTNNPRTIDRGIPSGQISKPIAWLLVLICCAVYFLSAYMLNDLCLKLSPFILIILFVYSYTKHFTWLCHVCLGLCLGMAPIAGWLAVSGEWALTPFILGVGVMFWVAGFDIIYASQDAEFDKKAGLYSIPSYFGLAKGLKFSSAFHAVCFVLFVLTGLSAGLSNMFYILMIPLGGLLFWEHILVKPNDLSRVNLAFFKLNATVSGVMLLAVIAGL